MILDRFRKPTLNVKLIDKGSKAKVNLINATPDQTMILFYMATKQIAKSLKLDHRQFLNSLVALDKRIVKNQKDTIRQVKYGKKSKKKK